MSSTGRAVGVSWLVTPSTLCPSPRVGRPGFGRPGSGGGDGLQAFFTERATGHLGERRAVLAVLRGAHREKHVEQHPVRYEGGRPLGGAPGAPDDVEDLAHADPALGAD